jgi:hypothetical protein
LLDPAPKLSKKGKNLSKLQTKIFDLEAKSNTNGFVTTIGDNNASSESEDSDDELLFE